MRKIDYQILAETIEKAYKAGNSSLANGADWRHGYRMACEAIARQFANRARVDSAAFLKACGIE